MDYRCNKCGDEYDFVEIEVNNYERCGCGGEFVSNGDEMDYFDEDIQ